MQLDLVEEVLVTATWLAVLNGRYEAGRPVLEAGLPEVVELDDSPAGIGLLNPIEYFKQVFIRDLVCFGRHFYNLIITSSSSMETIIKYDLSIQLIAISSEIPKEF